MTRSELRSVAAGIDDEAGDGGAISLLQAVNSSIANGATAQRRRRKDLYID